MQQASNLRRGLSRGWIRLFRCWSTHRSPRLTAHALNLTHSMENYMTQMHKAMTVGAIAVAAMVPTSGLAQQLSDQWQFRASVYGWLPDIGGKTTFPADGGSSINVDASKIIGALKFTFMGTIEAQKGRWGGFTD